MITKILAVFVLLLALINFTAHVVEFVENDTPGRAERGMIEGNENEH
jgi:hypothetical protein